MSDTKPKTKKSIIITLVVAAIVISGIAIYKFGGDSLGSEHIHAQYGIILEDTKLEFDPAKNPEYVETNEKIFIEDKYPYLIHRFAPKADLGMLFNSMGIEFNSECFILDKPISGLNNTEFCNNGNKTLKLFVNNATNNQFDAYVPLDRDRILILYGNQTDKEIQDEITEFNKFRHIMILDGDDPF